MVHLLHEVLLNYGHHPSRKLKTHVSNRVNEPSDPVRFSELLKKHVNNRLNEPSDPIKFSELLVSPLPPEGHAFEYRWWP